MAHNRGAAAAIFDQHGHILLVKHNYGRFNWELPGGGSEPNESTVETAIREVREETGLDVVAQSTTGVYYEAEDDFLHFVFRCRPQDAARVPQPDGSEITDCRYWPPDALPRPINDFTVRRIRDAIGNRDMPLPITITPRRWLD